MQVIESDLPEAAKISIVYVILFALIFIDYIVYKLVKSKQKVKKINPDLIDTNRKVSIVIEMNFNKR